MSIISVIIYWISDGYMLIADSKVGEGFSDITASIPFLICNSRPVEMELGRPG